MLRNSASPAQLIRGIEMEHGLQERGDWICMSQVFKTL